MKDGWLRLFRKSEHDYYSIYSRPLYFNNMTDKCWVAGLSLKCACQEKLKHMCPENG